MSYLALKVILSALIVVAVSELARRSPAIGALAASLPLVSVPGMIWLWRDTGDTMLLANHAEATFWYVLPSLPMFLLMPALLRNVWPFWPSLAAGIVVAAALYLLTAALLARFGIRR